MVEIGQDRAETRAAPTRAGQTGGGRAIPEQSPRLLKPKGVQLLREMCHKDVQLAISVDVSQGHPHVPLIVTEHVEGEAARQGFFLEGVVMPIDP